jgi:hypothetical protein
VDISTLAKRARLQRITTRSTDLDNLRDMLDGTWEPTNGLITPSFKAGTARHAAFLRAIKNTSTTVPLILSKSLAGIDFGSITWSDAEAQRDAVDDALARVPLARIARDLATELKITGVAAGMSHTPTDPDGRPQAPTIEVLTGINVPYTDPTRPGSITGWYRALQYSDDAMGGVLRWWVEAYDFVGDDITVHRVWRELADPTALATTPDDEFESTARPRFALAGIQPDGLPSSPMLANAGRILGLYATELRLATSEELSAFPMLVTRGEAEMEQVGPAEVITVDADGDAKWLDPGKLGELRDQANLKRDQLREAFNLPGGSLGGQTPSGEALAEANRSFMQESRSLAGELEKTLTDLATDYLAILGLPPVSVSVPIDRSYTTASLLDVVEKGIDLGAIPQAVAARMFQSFVGNAYSDDELSEFLDEIRSRRTGLPAGTLTAADDA